MMSLGISFLTVNPFGDGGEVPYFTEEVLRLIGKGPGLNGEFFRLIGEVLRFNGEVLHLTGELLCFNGELLCSTMELAAKSRARGSSDQFNESLRANTHLNQLARIDIIPTPSLHLSRLS